MPETATQKAPIVRSNSGNEEFVGIKCEEGGLIFCAPMGFYGKEEEADLNRRLSGGDKDAKENVFKDLNLIIRLIKKTVEENLFAEAAKYADTAFPVQAYFYIIRNYLEQGLYRERETEYKTGLFGRINWSRTIKNKQAYISGNNAYYLDFVTQRHSYRDDLLITLIHEAVVYECFRLLGSFFSEFVPPRPRLDYESNKAMFAAFLKNRLVSTFRDREKELFNNMLAVLEDKTSGKTGSFKYGIIRFEYVWESAVNTVFGVDDIEDYCPRALWYLGNDTNGAKAEDDDQRNAGKRKAPLRPDTIMRHGGGLYILDAKYYRFGIDKTAGVQALPGTDSIQKQITYGEHAEKQKEKGELTGFGEIWNAFIMPFNKDNGEYKGDSQCLKAGENVKYWFRQKAHARAEWKENVKNYHTVYGICADVRGLLEAADKGGSEQEKKALAEFIRECKQQLPAEDQDS